MNKLPNITRRSLFGFLLGGMALPAKALASRPSPPEEFLVQGRFFKTRGEAYFYALARHRQSLASKPTLADLVERMKRDTELFEKHLMRESKLTWHQTQNLKLLPNMLDRKFDGGWCTPWKAITSEELSAYGRNLHMNVRKYIHERTRQD